MYLTVQILCSVCIIAMIYVVYQLLRNKEVFLIRINWVNLDDNRESQYTYEYMFYPAKHNWYGLKWPKEKDFK
jgi:hypothetical protein